VRARAIAVSTILLGTACFNFVLTGKDMSTKIFFNLPVKNINQAVAFFTKLELSFNPQFTGETRLYHREQRYIRHAIN
jgi:hypothetical protein